MTAAVSQSPSRQAVYTSEALFPLSVDQYHDLIRAGTLSDADPVELLEGMLVYKMTKNPPHTLSNQKLRLVMEALLPAGFDYRSQDPVTLSDGEPEPDGAVARGQMEDYATRHPGPAEVPLIIEVADTSLDRDRGIKLRSYARAAIAEYWIVNLVEQQVEVYTSPDAQAPDRPTYQKRVAYRVGDSVPLVIDGRRLGEVSVADVLA